MAGDWLKMELTTPDKPETFAITAEMGWDDPDLTVGKLFRVWRWFDQQTLNGNARGVTLKLLDRIASVTGFAQAMINVGWLIETEEGLSLPKFDKHNGASGKSRAQGTKRVKEYRASVDSPGSNEDCNALTVTKPLPEKRREEKSIKNHITTTTVNSDSSDENSDLEVVVENLNQAPMPKQQDPVLKSTPAIDMTVALRKVGVNAMSNNPIVEDWIAKGISIQMALEAVTVARRSKPVPANIPPGYLNAILAEMIAPKIKGNPAPLPEPKGWWETASGIAAQGEKIGVQKIDGEPFPAYKIRVHKAAGSGPWNQRR